MSDSLASAVIPTRLVAALAAIVALSGCGGTSVQVVTRTVVETVTAPQSTSSATAPQSTSSASSPQSASGGSKVFSGNGVKSVGTITVRQDSTLYWTCSGACATFSIGTLAATDTAPLFLEAQGQHSGTSAVIAGTYRQVQVSAEGNWTVRITPG